jgi:glycosyltransferase involved in cell wall biosynthesis
MNKINAARQPKLAYLATHPIQYQAPMLRYIVDNSNIDLTALFMSDFSLKTYHDKQFGATFKWDVPLVEGYKHIVLPSLGDNSSIQNPRPFNYGFKEIFQQEGFDALWTHGHSHQNSVRAIKAAHGLGIKTMTRAESQHEVSHGAGLHRRMRDAAMLKVFAMLDAFLCVGTANREYYKSWGIDESKMFTVPYAVDNASFQERTAAAVDQADELAKEWGIDRNRPVILYCSKLTERKKIMNLARAYDQLSVDGKEPHAQLLIVGDGEQRPELEAWIAERHWDSVKFVGFQNQTVLPAVFRLSDIFVLASAREPWGLIVNEVMNAGMPVIVSDEVGSRFDLVEEGRNGYIVPVESIETLSDRLRTLSSDDDLRRSMGQRSLEIINNWGYREDLIGLVSALNALGFNAECTGMHSLAS